MTSVLGKLICRELGKEKYNRYFQYLGGKQSTEVFCDIYLELCEKDPQILNEMLVRLLETVHLSVRISKRFIFAVLFYLVTITVMLLILPINFVFILASTAATMCLIYKAGEFLRNRYCDKDIRMVLIYKSVLFHLLQETKNED